MNTDALSLLSQKLKQKITLIFKLVLVSVLFETYQSLFFLTLG